MLGALFVTQYDEPFSELEIGLRPLKQGYHQRTQVEAGAAHKDSRVIARLDLSNRALGKAGVISCREVFSRFDYIDQMMWDSSAFSLRDLGCCDVNAAIDLNRIQIDDLALACQSELDAQLALT